MLLEPTPTTLAPPASDTPTPETSLPELSAPTPITPHTVPPDLRVLARRARHDARDARELATVLLARGASPATTARLTGLDVEAARALATVRHPGTAAGWVADDMVDRVRARREAAHPALEGEPAEPGTPTVPAPRTA